MEILTLGMNLETWVNSPIFKKPVDIFLGGLEGKFHLMNRLYVYMIIGHSVYDYESGRFSKLVRCKYFMCLIKTSCLLFLELQFSHLQLQVLQQIVILRLNHL